MMIHVYILFFCLFLTRSLSQNKYIRICMCYTLIHNILLCIFMTFSLINFMNKVHYFSCEIQNFSKLKRKKKQHCDNLTCKTSNKKKTSDDTKSQAVTTLFHWNFFVHVHIQSLCFFAYTLFGHRGQSIVDNGRLYAMYSI